MTNLKPLTDETGEVRELTAEDMRGARRGRPSLPAAVRKQRINLMLDPDVIAQLKSEGNMSAIANAILREKLGLS
jgi:uncharacterized protein (DUF4415 family)